MSTIAFYCFRSSRGNKHLPVVYSLSGLDMRPPGGAPFRVPCIGAELGLRTNRLPHRWLHRSTYTIFRKRPLDRISQILIMVIELGESIKDGFYGAISLTPAPPNPSFVIWFQNQQLLTSQWVAGDSLVCNRVLLHVDVSGSVPGRAQAAQIRNGSNENAVSMLDGVHMDLIGHAVLPTATRLLRATLRRKSSHLHARLGQHGRLYHHPRHTGAFFFFDFPGS